jgi:hypothetical protein
MKANSKFCQKCRAWISRDFFYRNTSRLMHQADRICMSCRDEKNELIRIYDSARGLNQRVVCATRARELAIIPDPFVKKHFEPKSVANIFSWEPV